ncbi:MAG: hypothetical protein DRQ04_02805, partial [Candidatus Hydrothermota bacterium]
MTRNLWKGLLLFILLPFLWAQEGQLIDKVAAKVDGETIALSEVEEAYNLYRTQVSQKEMSDEELRKYVLDELINRKLLYLVARDDTTITVTDEEVNQALEEQLKSIEESMGKEQFEAELKRQGITRDELKKEYAELVRENLYVNKYIEKYVKPKIKVTPEEIRKFYEENKDSIPSRPDMVRLA